MLTREAYVIKLKLHITPAIACIYWHFNHKQSELCAWQSKGIPNRIMHLELIGTSINYFLSNLFHQVDD